MKDPLMQCHVSHAVIADLIARGYIVESRAIGRIGLVVEAHSLTGSCSCAYVADSFRKTARRYVTSFERGDRVRLVRVPGQRKVRRIVNYVSDLKRLLAK